MVVVAELPVVDGMTSNSEQSRLKNLFSAMIRGAPRLILTFTTI
jgi:hypothetical protein